MPYIYLIDRKLSFFGIKIFLYPLRKYTEKRATCVFIRNIDSYNMLGDLVRFCSQHC